MKRYLLLLFLFFALIGDEFPLAPLMPLIPGDPLELNGDLRKRLFAEDQSARNVAIFESYRFPWVKSLVVVLLMSGTPLILYIWLETMRKIRNEEIPTFSEILLQLKELDSKHYSPRELAFEVAKLFKRGFKNGSSKTYQELMEYLNGRLSNEHMHAFQKQFQALEKIQYQPEEPSKAEVEETIEHLKSIPPF